MKVKALGISKFRRKCNFRMYEVQVLQLWS